MDDKKYNKKRKYNELVKSNILPEDTEKGTPFTLATFKVEIPEPSIDSNTATLSLDNTTIDLVQTQYRGHLELPDRDLNAVVQLNTNGYDYATALDIDVSNVDITPPSTDVNDNEISVSVPADPNWVDDDDTEGVVNIDDFLNNELVNDNQFDERYATSINIDLSAFREQCYKDMQLQSNENETKSGIIPFEIKSNGTYTIGDFDDVEGQEIVKDNQNRKGKMTIVKSDSIKDTKDVESTPFKPPNVGTFVVNVPTPTPQSLTKTVEIDTIQNNVTTTFFPREEGEQNLMPILSSNSSSDKVTLITTHFYMGNTLYRIFDNNNNTYFENMTGSISYFIVQWNDGPQVVNKIVVDCYFSRGSRTVHFNINGSNDNENYVQLYDGDCNTGGGWKTFDLYLNNNTNNAYTYYKIHAYPTSGNSADGASRLNNMKFIQYSEYQYYNSLNIINKTAGDLGIPIIKSYNTNNETVSVSTSNTNIQSNFTGNITVPLESKTLEVTSPGTTTITPSNNYYGIKQVLLTTYVNNYVDYTNNNPLEIRSRGDGTITIPEGYTGLGEINYNVTIPSDVNNYNDYDINNPLEITSRGDGTITIPEGYTGLGEISYNVTIPSDVNNYSYPTITTNGTYSIPSGYSGLNSIVVSVTPNKIGYHRIKYNGNYYQLSGTWSYYNSSANYLTVGVNKITNSIVCYIQDNRGYINLPSSNFAVYTISGNFTTPSSNYTISIITNSGDVITTVSPEYIYNSEGSSIGNAPTASILKSFSTLEYEYKT